MRAALASRRWGRTIEGAVAASAARYPLAVAIHDEAGAISYRELWERSDAFARTLRERDVGAGRTVGVLCGNHRWFVVVTLAVRKVGADVVLLNPTFAAPEIEAVVAGERIDVLIHDDELAASVAGMEVPTISRAVVEDLSSDRTRGALQPASPSGRLVILTSGTTGRARGAVRRGSAGLVGSVALLERIPFRARDTVVVAAPLFHSWGLGTAVLALGLSGTVVLQRRFDPEATMVAVAGHRADVLVVVPVMLQRILDLGGEGLVAFDTRSLRVIASSGSALGSPLAERTLRRFGPVLYNVYGSTEVSAAAIATPRQLLAEPSTAGSPAFGATVAVLGDDGAPVPAGAKGEIFVGSDLRFDGYADGSTRATRDGLLATGDVGHVDAEGRLFVDGRADDMIVSGGENVYPVEIEEVLATHAAIADVAVAGRPRSRVRAADRRVRGAATGADRDGTRPQGPRPAAPRPLQGASRGRRPRRAAAGSDRQGAP